MDDRKRRFYVTTPIYYVNGRPHIGHAYASLAADVLARFWRLDGAEVLFLTGTDEHGQKVEKSAKAAGVDPQAFTDRMSEQFRALTPLMGFSNDDFIRTTEPRHIKAAQAFWTRLVEAGQIYLGSYAGWYSVVDEAYYGEDELALAPDGGRLAPTGAAVEWVEEPSYFFRLSEWGDRLLAFYEANPGFILPPGRRNEVVSFVRQGLRDLSISRTTFAWGIKVPGDESHIMYVWLDALVNYISALGFPETGKSSLFDRLWPADLHVVGKEIVRFHAVYWPAFLMAAGLEPPRRVFAHGWWTVDQEKMSKSLGNGLPPNELVETYGLDQARYVLMREIPFGNDGDFSHQAAVARINADLANGLGNLAQRTLTLIAKNCAGLVPEPGELQAADDALIAQATALLGEVRRELDNQAIHRALERIWTVIGAADAYIDAQAPWALRKTDTARMATVLYVLADAIRRVALLVQPWMPGSAARLLDQLGVAETARDFAAFDTPLVPGTALPAPQGLFPRIAPPAAA